MDNENTSIDNVNDPRWKKYIMDDTRHLRQPKVGDYLRSWADRIAITEVGDQVIVGDLCDRAIRVRVVEVYSPEDSEVHQYGDSLLFFLGDLLAKEPDGSDGYTYDDPSKMIEAEQVLVFIDSLKEQTEREMKGDAYDYLDRLYMMVRAVSEI